jgi:hypothetical protein
MKTVRVCTCLLILAVLAWLGSPTRAAKPSPAAAEFFEKQVRPLLVQRCQRCHGDKRTEGGLKLTSRASLLEGGDNGPAAVAGKPGKSLLVKAIHYKDDDLKMPPKGKLPDGEIAVLTRWVEMGLPWPETKVDPSAANGKKFLITAEQRKFWSFQPVKAVTPPAVKDGTWARSGLDRFLLAALEARGLKPAPPADKRTLLRRATFDLTGLPPTPREIDDFLRDDSPDAFARVVDRLLASPRYGERWARHWLDVVRYTDSFDARILDGAGSEMDITEAWRYRDWVVNAFNRDLPYDRFILHQIAGDLLPAQEKEAVNADGIVATGLLAIGNWGGGDADKEKLLTDIVDDQIDVVSRAFLGLTVACARCHDHKFDPISTEDYYGLAGIFFSTHILPNGGPKTNGPPMLRIPLLSREELARRARYQTRVAGLEKKLNAAAQQQSRLFARKMLGQTAKYVAAAWEYQHQPSSLAKLSLAEFASRKGLYEFALRRWADFLGLGEYRLMTTPVRNVLGNTGVHAWKGDPDCPSLTVNSTTKQLKILTFTLPPRSVSVHPGPTNGVAVGWKSPITGTVKITGRLRDADPAGGDGIAWIVDHRSGGTRRQLAAGDFANGGAQDLAGGKNGHSLAAVRVKAGDMIELLVLPKDNYVCDTTVVELVIAQRGGSAAWDLSRDIVDDLHQGGKGNPHSDRLGNKAVWHFYDMADSNRAKRPAGAAPTALAEWHRLLGAGQAGRGKVEEAARAFQKKFTLADARSPFWIKDPKDYRHFPAATRDNLRKLAGELAALKKNSPPPADFANGAQEGGVPGSPHAGVHDVRVHIRGSYSRLGETVPRRFPQVLAGEKQTPITRGSGRLQLAEWIARPDHPLTARVMANRIWQHHFGEGLVRTPSNFGKLGERPTHPELLDYLARRFIASGWSVKKMHREIMLSAAYQQSSEPPEQTLKADPGNSLFGRMNRRRLEAEAIRDSLLAVAGWLDETHGGRAVRDFSSPRRTLYLLTVRSDRSGFRPLFDVADSTAPVEKRLVSTVAPQALFLLNHPFVLTQTRALARRIIRARADEAGQVRKVYLILFGRLPSAEEVQIGREFLARAAKSAKTREAAWEEYCQVLLCTNEFIYVD